MLPARARVRRRAEFAVAQRGNRARVDGLVLHYGRAGIRSGAVPSPSPRLGFIVGKSVGSAVVRNHVRRRLRHIAASWLPTLPDDCVLVVRALPPAGAMSTSQLRQALDRGIQRLGLVGTA